MVVVGSHPGWSQIQVLLNKMVELAWLATVAAALPEQTRTTLSSGLALVPMVEQPKAKRFRSKQPDPPGWRVERRKFGIVKEVEQIVRVEWSTLIGRDCLDPALIGRERSNYCTFFSTLTGSLN